MARAIALPANTAAPRRLARELVAAALTNIGPRERHLTGAVQSVSASPIAD